MQLALASSIAQLLVDLPLAESLQERFCIDRLNDTWMRQVYQGFCFVIEPHLLRVGAQIGLDDFSGKQLRADIWLGSVLTPY